MSIDFSNHEYEGSDFEPLVSTSLTPADDGEASLRPQTLDQYIGQSKAKANLEGNTFTAETWEEVKAILEKNNGGFVKTKWCGSLDCELAMKDKVGVSSRCMPLEQSGTTGKCPVCGKECATDIIWGVAY